MIYTVLAGSAASQAESGAGCRVEVTVNDALTYSVSEISVPAECTEFTVELTHTGQLQASVMGHNWVLVPQGTAQEIATAGASAGLDGDYLPDDDRILAATEVIGGGESTRITFPVDDLSGTYEYVCTFPGHWGTMRGTFEVAG